MGKGCKIIHKDCDPSLCQDRSLPYTAFMIEYREGGCQNLILLLVLNK